MVGVPSRREIERIRVRNRRQRRPIKQQRDVMADLGEAKAVLARYGVTR